MTNSPGFNVNEVSNDNTTGKRQNGHRDMMREMAGMQ